MIFVIRAIPYLSSAILLLILELSLSYYKLWAWWFSLIALIVILTVLLLNKFHFNKETLGFIISPLILSWGCFAFIFFQEQMFWQQLIIAGTVLIYFFFVNNIFLFLYRIKFYISYSLENISAYSNLLAVFFIYVSCFSFYMLSIFRLRWLFLIITVSTLALTWQGLWINKINLRRYGYIAFVMALIIGEIFWALHFWPTSFFVNGIILTVVYYVFINLTKLHCLESLSKKMTLRYIIISSVILGVTLVTAQWS